MDLVDFPARAALFAEEIREREPDLVGLQEVTLWHTGRIGDPAPATEVRYDYLALLMGELAASGHPYDAAVVQDEADLDAPAGAPYNVDVRLPGWSADWSTPGRSCTPATPDTPRGWATT